jgi:hypothetical protein
VQLLEERDLLGQAAVARGARPDVSGVVSGRGRAGGLKEDRLGIPGREYAVRLGRARPEQQRRALRRRAHRDTQAEIPIKTIGFSLDALEQLAPALAR